jgi:hypothetical protein
MPLSSKSPDLHQPVEHFRCAEGKIKKWVQHEADIYDPAMFSAHGSALSSLPAKLMAGAEPTPQVCQGP